MVITLLERLQIILRLNPEIKIRLIKPKYQMVKHDQNKKVIGTLKRQ